MRTPFTGVGTALVTPFAPNGAIDDAAVRRLVRRQIDAGVHFVSPCGTTGEAPTLTPMERIQVVELVVEETAGRVPVLAGAGGYHTLEVIDLVRECERAGRMDPVGHAVLQQADAGRAVSALQGNRRGHLTSDRALQRTRRTGVNLDVATVARLAALPNIVGIKEASGNVVQMSEIIAAVPDDFVLVSGDDSLAVAAMAVGARGLISVASNAVPAEIVQIIEFAEKQDYLAARRLHHWLLPFLQVNFVESNPIPIKAAMAAMGLMDDTYRLPLVPASPAARDRIMTVLQDLKLLGSAARL